MCHYWPSKPIKSRKQVWTWLIPPVIQQDCFNYWTKCCFGRLPHNHKDKEKNTRIWSHCYSRLTFCLIKRCLSNIAVCTYALVWFSGLKSTSMPTLSSLWIMLNHFKLEYFKVCIYTLLWKLFAYGMLFKRNCHS